MTTRRAKRSPSRARQRSTNAFNKEELEEAFRAIVSTINKCVKVKPKLSPGSSQHTLLVRRIKALRVASALIKRELGMLR